MSGAILPEQFLTTDETSDPWAAGVAEIAKKSSSTPPDPWASGVSAVASGGIPAPDYKKPVLVGEDGSDPWAAGVMEQMAQDNPRLKSAIRRSLDANPEETAKAYNIALSQGQPLELIRRNLFDVERANQEAQIAADMGRAPNLSVVIQNNPAHAEMAAKNYGNLIRIEEVATGFVPGLSQGWDTASLQASLTPFYIEDRHGLLTPERRKKMEELEQKLHSIGGKYEENTGAGYTGYQIANVIRQQVGSMTAGARGALTGASVGAAAGFLMGGVGAGPGAAIGAGAGYLTESWNYAYDMERGGAFRELSQTKGLDGVAIPRDIAGPVADAVGMINATIELASDVVLAKFGGMLVSGGKLALKNAVLAQVKAALAEPTRRALLIGAAQKLMTVGFTEGAEEFVQAFVGAGGREAAQALTGNTFAPDSFMKDLSGASSNFMDAFVGTTLTLGAFSGGMHIIVEGPQVRRRAAELQAYSALIGEQNKQTQAVDKAAQYGEMLANAGTVEMRANAPEAFHDVVKQITPDETVYLDAAVLNQMPAEVIAALPEDVKKELSDAISDGAPVAVPLASILTVAPGTPLEAAVQEYGRASPDAYNLSEAKEARANTPAFLKDQADKIAAQSEDQAAWLQSVDNVRQAARQQLAAVGRGTTDVQHLQADFLADIMAVQAHRSGMTPEAFYQKFGPRIGGTTQGAVLGQASQIEFDPNDPNILRQSNAAPQTLDDVMEQWGNVGIKHAVSEKNGVITLSQIIVPAETRNQGAGTFAMRSLIDYANRTGQIIALSPSADFGGNRTRLVKFYKSLGFKENKGKSRDLSISEAMTKKPDEALRFAQTPAQPDTSPLGTFNPETLTINLLENANLSTFMHEIGHWYLEVLERIALSPDAPAEMVKDWAAVLKWGKVTQEQWTAWKAEYRATGKIPAGMTALHERFAETFEAYLFSGKAPSIEMQSTFRRLRTWMISVYRTLEGFMTGRGLSLDHEIVQVFNKMMATDEQIAEAEAAAGLMPDPDATVEAIEKLDARSLRDLKWSINARNRTIKKLQAEVADLRKGIVAEVNAEVQAEPVYRAIRFLRRGEATAEDGTEIKAEGKHRLSIEALEQMFPEARVGPVRVAGNFDLASLRGMTAKDGLHPDEVAAMFDGFEDGAALVRALAEAEPIRDRVTRLASERMMERHGDLSTPEAIQAAANEAIHNEARARSLATEFAAQRAALGARADTGQTTANGSRRTVNVLMAAVDNFAKDLIARAKVKGLRKSAQQHKAAEIKAAKAWEKATAAGKTEEALQAKRDQMLHHAAVKEIQAAQAELRKHIDFYSRVARGSNERIVKGGRSPDIVNAMRAILAGYGISPRLEKTAKEYLDIVEREDPATFDALKPVVEQALAFAMPYAELSVEEARALHESLQQMWELARETRQIEIRGQKMDIRAAADPLMARMENIGIPGRVPGEGWAVTPEEKRASYFQYAVAMLTRVEQWAERMDGKYGGPFLRYVFQPIKDAAELYRVDRAKYRAKFTDLVRSVSPFVPKGEINAEAELGYIFGRGADNGTAELLHAVLHTGNESNKRKLLLGRGWAREREDGSLDTSRWDAFLDRMYAENKLVKEHFDFVQGVWDLLEETKPLAQQAHRRVFGRFFAEVTADPVSTPWGLYRGGYVPAQVDARIVKDGELKKAAEAENEAMSYAFPSVGRGFTMSRVEYNKPLLLDLRTLSQHIDKVLLFAHMQPAVNDVRRVITQKDVAAALNRISPAVYTGILIPWLNRSARQIVETPTTSDGGLSRALSVIRARTGMAFMFGNVSNTLQQITGFLSAKVKMQEFGKSSYLSATAQFLSDPKKMKEFVADSSLYMRDLMLNEIAAMNAAVEDIVVNPTLVERGKAWTNRHAYFMQAAMANVMNPIIWVTAYNQALENGMAHGDAVRYSDGVIRQTQGSTLPEDISNFETGPAALRLFTQFVGWFNTIANTNATRVMQIVGDVGLRKGAGKLLYVALVGVLMPIWIAEAIALAARGGPGDEDRDGEYLDDWIMAVLGIGTLRGLAAQVPIAGQVGQLVVNRFNANPADDKFSMSPAVSLIEMAVGSPWDVYKAIVDEGSAQKAIRSTAAAATLATGLPMYTFARPLGYGADVAIGKIEPSGPVDFGRGLVTGATNRESRRP